MSSSSSTNTPGLDQLKILADYLESSRGITTELREQLNLNTRLSESDKATLSLSRQVSSALQERTKELREQNKLLTKYNSVSRIISKLKLEEVVAAKNLSKEGMNYVDVLRNVAKVLGVNSEAYINILSNVKDIEREEVSRLVLLNQLVLNSEKYSGLLEDEMIKQKKINKYLGISGALVDNLQNIGLRAFGGLGINLGVFNDALDEAKKLSTGVSENFVSIEDLLSSVSKSSTSFTNFTSELSTLSRTSGSEEAYKELRNSLIASTGFLVKTSDKVNDFSNKEQEILSKQAEKQNELARIAEEYKKEVDLVESDTNLTDYLKQQALYAIGVKYQGELNTETEKYNVEIEKLRDDLGKISAELADQAATTSTSTKQWKTLKTIIPGIGKAIVSGILDPLSGILFSYVTLQRAFKELNAAQTEFRRLTGESANSFAQLSYGATNAVETIKVASELTKQIGINSEEIFSASRLAYFSEMKNYFKLSDEEIGNLSKYVQIFSENGDNFENSLERGVKSGNKLANSAISLTLGMQEALKVSSDISVSLGMNIERLASASTQALALGISLKEVDSIASSLLDFESSIESELQAQLMTGKELNLNKARELALTNQLDLLTSEIKNNIVTSAEFADMNRFAQEDLAKALGLSREQLGKIVLQQDLTNSLTDQQKANIRGVTLEESKHLEVMERLKMSFTSLAQSIVGIVEPIVTIVTKFDGLVETFLILSAISKTLMMLEKAKAIWLGITLGHQKKHQANLVREAAIKQGILTIEGRTTATRVAGTVAGFGGVGGVLGVITAVAGAAILAGIIANTVNKTKQVTQTKDVSINPNGGLVIGEPRGTYQIQPLAQGTKDDKGFLASNPERGGRIKSTNSNIVQSIPDEFLNSFNDIKKTNKELTERFDKLIKIVEKGGTVNIDGRYAGEALVLGSYNSA